MSRPTHQHSAASGSGRRWLARSISGRTGIGATVAAGALLLAGCGGGVAAQQSDASASSSGSCGSSVKIGAPLPFTGPFQQQATSSFQGMQVAVGEINAAGGIKSLGGAKLQLVKGDVSGTDTGQATSATTQLVSQGVVAMSGAWSSSQTVPVAAVAQSSGIPLVSQAAADALTQNGNHFFFRPTALASQQGAQGVGEIIDAAKSAGITFTRVTAVAPNDVANQTQYKAAVAAFGAAGATAEAPTFYTAGLTDVTPIVSSVKAANPDLILTGGSPADAVLIVKGLRNAGITAPIVSFGGGGFAEESFAQALGGSVTGIAYVVAFNPDFPLTGVRGAAQEYVKKYKVPFMPSEAGESWVDIQIIAAAIQKAGSCQPAKIADALHAIDIKSGPAASVPGGRVQFTAEGRNPNAVPVLVQWQGGVPKTVWPQNLASAKFALPGAAK